MRKKCSLTLQEFSKFKRLQPFQNEALNFWAAVANARNLDPKSMLTDGDVFTALPLNHDKHWCYPLPLKCKKKPVYDGD